MSDRKPEWVKKMEGKYWLSYTWGNMFTQCRELKEFPDFDSLLEYLKVEKINPTNAKILKGVEMEINYRISEIEEPDA